MIIFYIFIFLLGISIGSFLNVVILRLEKKEHLAGRSHCPHCNHTLSWLDLMPVVSFLFLRGVCRYCHKRISWQYPIVEILTGLIFLLIFNFQLSIINQLSVFEFSNAVTLLFLFYVASSLIVIFVYDLKHFLIPDVVLFPAIAITFFYRLLFSLSDFYLFIVAALLASGFFLTIFLISKGRWMGFGDVKLAILLGLIVGLPNIIAALFLAFFSGAIIGLGLMLLKRKGLKSEIPFGPFLIFGTFVALFWGQEMIKWYMHFLIF